MYTTGHVVTVAASGAGKGRRAVLPNLLTYPGPVWVLDLKGENYLVSARARREAGHEVAVIDPFGVTGEASASVNLLDAINTADADCVSAADELARALVTQESEQSDSHWTEQAAFLLQGLILYAASLPDGSLLDVRKALTMSGTDTVDLLEDLASSEELAFGQVARVANAQLNTNERERSSIWSTARRFTAFLDDPRIADACRTTTTDLKLKGKSKSIFLVVPPTKMKSCRTFVCARLNAA
ncbi:MAG: type IV secretory system conjugative DNA transfer family protein, partial [Myxococcota bacterium]